MATDNLGRDVGGGMNSQDLKGIVASLAKGKVGEAKPFNKTASNQKTAQILSLKSCQKSLMIWQNF